MSYDHSRSSSSSGESATSAGSAGKRTLTERIQRKARGGGEEIGQVTVEAQEAPQTVGAVAEGGFSGAGGAVPYAAELGQAFGVDFSHVRSHSDDRAAEACEGLGAHAYAVGSDVAFASPTPDKEVVAHELAHVVQQTGGSPSVARKGFVDDDSALEAEADVAAHQAVHEGRVTTPFFSANSRLARLANLGSVTFTKNPRTPLDLRQLLPGTFLGPFTVTVHSRTVAEWTRFFSDWSAMDQDDGMHDVYAFMSLAVGRPVTAALVGSADDNRPYSQYTIGGRAPTEEQAVDCMVGLLQSGSNCHFANGYAAAVIDEFMTRYTPLAIVRNSRGGRQMQRADVEAVGGVNDSMRYLSDRTNDILIASGLGTASGAAMQVLDAAPRAEQQGAQPERVNLMRNGALTCRGALDSIESYEQINAASMMGTFSVAAAAVGPLTSGLSMAAQLAASGLSAAAQAWFGQLAQLHPEQRRRDLKDRFRAQIEPYARQRGIDINTTGTLLNTFDNALDY